MTFYESCRQSSHLSLALLTAVARRRSTPARPEGPAERERPSDPGGGPRDAPVELGSDARPPSPALFGYRSAHALAI